MRQFCTVQLNFSGGRYDVPFRLFLLSSNETLNRTVHNDDFFNICSVCPFFLSSSCNSFDSIHLIFLFPFLPHFLYFSFKLPSFSNFPPFISSFCCLYRVLVSFPHLFNPTFFLHSNLCFPPGTDFPRPYSCPSCLTTNLAAISRPCIN